MRLGRASLEVSIMAGGLTIAVELPCGTGAVAATSRKVAGPGWSFHRGFSCYGLTAEGESMGSVTAEWGGQSKWIRSR